MGTSDHSNILECRKPNPCRHLEAYLCLIIVSSPKSFRDAGNIPIKILGLLQIFNKNNYIFREKLTFSSNCNAAIRILARRISEKVRDNSFGFFVLFCLLRRMEAIKEAKLQVAQRSNLAELLLTLTSSFHLPWPNHPLHVELTNVCIHPSVNDTYLFLKIFKI